MESWRAFAEARDLDEALSTAQEVHREDDAVQESIRALCEKDFARLTRPESQALYNLLQNCDLVCDAHLKHATLCKALNSPRVAFRLAGVVGCQNSQLDEELVQSLTRICAEEPSPSGTVAARAATTLRGHLQWARDKDALCRIVVRRAQSAPCRLTRAAERQKRRV